MNGGIFVKPFAENKERYFHSPAMLPASLNQTLWNSNYCYADSGSI